MGMISENLVTGWLEYFSFFVFDIDFDETEVAYRHFFPVSLVVNVGKLNVLLRIVICLVYDLDESVILIELFWEYIIDSSEVDILPCTIIYFEVIKFRNPLYP